MGIEECGCRFGNGGLWLRFGCLHGHRVVGWVRLPGAVGSECARAHMRVNGGAWWSLALVGYQADGNARVRLGV